MTIDLISTKDSKYFDFDITGLNHSKSFHELFKIFLNARVCPSKRNLEKLQPVHFIIIIISFWTTAMS